MKDTMFCCLFQQKKQATLRTLFEVDWNRVAEINREHAERVGRAEGMEKIINSYKEVPDKKPEEVYEECSK